MSKKRIEKLERERDHYEQVALDAVRKLYMCMGWIAAQHNYHPLSQIARDPGDEPRWGNIWPND